MPAMAVKNLKTPMNIVRVFSTGITRCSSRSVLLMCSFKLSCCKSNVESIELILSSILISLSPDVEFFILL